MNTRHIVTALALILILLSGAIPAPKSAFTGNPQMMFNNMDNGQVTGLELSPDGTILYSVDSSGGTIKCWDTESGRLLRVWPGYRQIYATALSPDGKLLLAISPITGSESYLIDTSSGSDVSGLPAKFICGAFSPDGKSIVIGALSSLDGVAVYSIERGIVTVPLKFKSAAQAVAYSPDGKTIAAAGIDRKIHLFDAATGEETAVFGEKPQLSNTLAFSPDGKLLLASCYDNTLTAWNVKDKDSEYELKDFKEEPRLIRFSPDGSTAVIGSGYTQRLIKARNGKTIFDFKSKPTTLAIGRSSVFTNDGKKLYSGNFGISQWDVEDEKELSKIGGEYAAYCTSAAFSPDRKRLAIAADKAIKVIDMETGAFVASGNMKEFTEASALMFSEDGSALFVRTTAGIYTCDPQNMTVTGEHITEAGFPYLGQPARRIALGKKISVLVSKNGDSISVMNNRSDGDTNTIPLKFKISSVTLSSDGSQIAIYDNTNSLRLFSMPSVKEISAAKIREFIYEPALRISPNEKLLIAGLKNEVRVYTLPALREVKTVKTGIPEVSCIDFTPDGKTMIIASGTGTVHLWNTGTWKEKVVLNGHSSRVVSTAVSHDGKLLVTCGSDKFFRFWDIDKGELSASLVFSTSTMTVNGRPVMVKDFVTASPDGRYDGTDWGLTRLHWVVGNEVIPLKDFGASFKSPGLLGQILSRHLTEAPVDAAKRLFGKIRSVSGNDIIVSYSGARTIAQANEKFIVILDSGEQAQIEAVFPMMTSMKCRAVDASQKKQIRPGMPVFR